MPTFFAISFALQNDDVVFSVQGRTMSGTEHDRRLIMMCGNVVTTAYFELLKLPLSRSIELFEVWQQLRTDINEAEKKAAKKR